jgi:hypothetical protein
MFDLFESIEDCFAKNRILPCLALIYSGIDVIASLEAKPGEKVQKYFVGWVESYLLKAGPLHCSAIELYGARCGIVHTFTSRSNFSKNGKARSIYYAWGKANVADFEKASKVLGIGRNDVIMLHVRDLIDAFRQATVNFLDDVEAHPNRAPTIESALGQWFMDCNPKEIKSLVDLHDLQSKNLIRPPASTII